MIEISGLCKTFNEGRVNEVKSLQDVNIRISEGEFVIVIGANGSGKSTLLNTIAGSVIPTAGSINIDGLNLTRLPDYKRSKWVARVFQNPLSGTAPGLSILENFRMAALRTSRKNLKIGINDTFKSLVKERVAILGMGLEKKLNHPMGSLSSGQRQALTLLMSVMDDLKILLLDEPTAALDPRSAELVMKSANQLIKEYNLTALMVTHNLKDAYQYGSRLVQMEEGRILRDINRGEKRDLKPTDLYEWFM